jgi:hypothetical protein
VWIAQPIGADGGPDVRAHGRAPLPTLHRKPRSLGAFIAGYKSAVTKRINVLRNTPTAPVWQRNYHEHVIRDETALDAIRAYIANNPFHWAADRYNHLSI